MTSSRVGKTRIQNRAPGSRRNSRASVFRTARAAARDFGGAAASVGAAVCVGAVMAGTSGFLRGQIEKGVVERGVADP